MRPDREPSGARSPAASAFWAFLLAPLVGQGPQKGRQRVDIALRKARSLAETPVVGDLLHVHVVVVFFRQIVEFRYASIRAPRIPALGIGVARGVKGHRVAQTGQDAVVQIRRRQLDVAQSRNLEGAADALDIETLGREIRQPLAPAQAQVEVIGLDVGGDRRVARRGERVVSEIGEQPVLGIARARLADMTGEAIALLWILEQREALGLQRRKPRFPSKTASKVEAKGWKISVPS